jgi:A/G-specific adenine glycosylase
LATASSSSESSSISLLDSWLNHTDASFHDIDPEEAVQIRSALLTWYRQHRRRLPWRGDPPPWNGSTAQYGQSNQNKNKKIKKTPSSKDENHVVLEDDSLWLQKTYPVTAYGIWVSEIMLQQTRVEAVIPKWCQWMHTFPTVQALARATPEQINAIWAGLGYYRRARFLHKAAQQLVAEAANNNNNNNNADELDDENDDNLIPFPTTVAEWQRLPGVGRYTASAIASIAYGQNVPVVDGNACRVLSRLRAIANTIQAPALKDQHGWNLAAQIISSLQSPQPHEMPENSNHKISSNSTLTNESTTAGEINQAIMELGATHCAAPIGTGGIHPDDPLREFYWSTRIGSQAAARVFSVHNGKVENDNNSINHPSSVHRNNSTSAQLCPICAPHGIHETWENLQTCLSTQLAEVEEESSNKHDTEMDEMARRIGHSVFPLAPIKTAKREEVWTVAVIAYENPTPSPSSKVKRWLMVRRPEQGLLAGQWEFPAALVWTSDDNQTNNKKRKNKSTETNATVPVIASKVRSKALDEVLLELCPSLLRKGRRPLTRKPVGKEPIEHVFSHVRHTMYIEHAEWIASDTSVEEEECKEVSDRQSQQSRQVRWLCESDMKRVGVTSGVKKILRWVKQHSPETLSGFNHASPHASKMSKRITSTTTTTTTTANSASTAIDADTKRGRRC